MLVEESLIFALSDLEHSWTLFIAYSVMVVEEHVLGLLLADAFGAVF